jgi:hypothetical protein
MRKLLPIFVSCFALLLVNACSSGDGDSNPDAAPPAADAAPALPDGMAANPAVTTGLGQVCNAMTPCADATTTCLSVGGAASGFCSFECAADLAMGVNPEAAASQACATAYTSTHGSPLCAARIPEQVGTNSDWYCLVGCGVIDTTDLGDCPGGLTCTSNSCQ